jgi:hypothetical protein
MAKDSKPDFKCNTNGQEGSSIDAPCKAKCKVTYKFSFVSKVSLPYAVAVDGIVLPHFKDRPKRTDSTIIVNVDSGQSVSLYLNSDAHPDYRRQPVYMVQTKDADVEVSIREVNRKHSDSDAPVLIKPGKDEKGSRPCDQYQAKLTGDIWMRVSHKYIAAEVDALIPAGVASQVIKGVKSIYDGLPSAFLEIKDVDIAGAKRSVKIDFSDSDNPRDNITNYSLLKDGLPRVHPAGYAALFQAALDADVGLLKITSCWRPMLGSIAHRAGLGLDVNYVGSTRINRQELRLGGKKAPDTSNVSDDEIRLFKEYEQASLDLKKAALALEKASKFAQKPGLTSEERTDAQQKLKKARSDKDAAAEAKTDAERAWNEERDANEPVKVHIFRNSLLKCACVAQLFDPWFMDANTRDKSPMTPNTQNSSNEKLHAHHLHVTVHEPKILDR